MTEIESKLQYIFDIINVYKNKEAYYIYNVDNSNLDCNTKIFMKTYGYLPLDMERIFAEIDLGDDKNYRYSYPYNIYYNPKLDILDVWVHRMRSTLLDGEKSENAILYLYNRIAPQSIKQDLINAINDKLSWFMLGNRNTVYINKSYIFNINPSFPIWENDVTNNGFTIKELEQKIANEDIDIYELNFAIIKNFSLVNSEIIIGGDILVIEKTCEPKNLINRELFRFPYRKLDSFLDTIKTNDRKSVSNFLSKFYLQMITNIKKNFNEKIINVLK